MNEDLVGKLSKELGISANQVSREYWEMLILKEISQSPLAEFLAFAGGTALRLAYNSPRFSDDLDFYLKKKIPFSLFQKSVKAIAKKLDMEITDLFPKFNTFLAEFKIKEDYLPLPFRIKIEVRKKILRKGLEPRLLVSPAVNFQVLLPTLTIEEIQKFKMEALENRKEPRDLFDLWFISQQLRKPFKKPKRKIDPRILKRELSKYLPQKFLPVINQLAKD